MSLAIKYTCSLECLLLLPSRLLQACGSFHSPRRSHTSNPWPCLLFLPSLIPQRCGGFQSPRRSRAQSPWPSPPQLTLFLPSLIFQACGGFQSPRRSCAQSPWPSPPQLTLFLPSLINVVVFRVPEEAAPKVPGHLHPNSPAVAGGGERAGVHRQPGPQPALHRRRGRAVQPAVHLPHRHRPPRVQVRCVLNLTKKDVRCVSGFEWECGV